jgi:hypothetical protein
MQREIQISVWNGSHAAFFGTLIGVSNTLENLPLRVYFHRFSWHPRAPHRSQRVLVQSETHFQRIRSHLPVEHVRTGEVQDSAVVLVERCKPDVQSPGDGVSVESTGPHEFGVPQRNGLGNQAATFKTRDYILQDVGLFGTAARVVRVRYKSIDVAALLPASAIAAANSESDLRVQLLQVLSKERLDLRYLLSWDSHLEVFKIPGRIILNTSRSRAPQLSYFSPIIWWWFSLSLCLCSSSKVVMPSLTKACAFAGPTPEILVKRLIAVFFASP